MKAYNRETLQQHRDNWQAIGSNVEWLDRLNVIYDPSNDSVNLILHHNTATGFDAMMVTVSREQFESMNDKAIPSFLKSKIKEWPDAAEPDEIANSPENETEALG